MHYKFIYIRLCTGQQLMFKEQFHTVHGVCVCVTQLVIPCVAVLTEEQLCTKQGRWMYDPADYFVMPSWLFLVWPCWQENYSSFIDLQDKLHQTLCRWVPRWTLPCAVWIELLLLFLLCVCMLRMHVCVCVCVCVCVTHCKQTCLHSLKERKIRTILLVYPFPVQWHSWWKHSWVRKHPSYKTTLP